MSKKKKSASRRRSRKIKFKLKKNTVYTLFSLGLFLAAGLTLLPYIQGDGALAPVHTVLDEHFGWGGVVIPFLLALLGFLFLRLKFFLSQVNVSIGFLLTFVSLLALTQAGTIGSQLFIILSELLTTIGAKAVYIVGTLIGVIVLFDTSVDDMLKSVSFLFHHLDRLIPFGLFSGNKKIKPMVVSNKALEIKGGQKDAVSQSPSKGMAVTQPTIKKEQIQLTDKLITNTMTTTGIWDYPPLSLLSDASNQKAERGDIKKIATVIEKTLQSFGIEARVAEVNLGPAVTQYALEIALGTKVSKITSLANDIALATEAPTGQIRIEAPIPGRSLIGIEIPNRSLEIVTLRTMLASQAMQKSKSKLAVSMGLDVSGTPVIADIARMPHVLIAGTTGSGKSVMMNSIISSLLFRASPDEVKLILVDPKRVEFTIYNGIPHLLTPVIVEPEKILSALKWSMAEMDRRYKLFAEQGVRNIDGYNELSGFQALPYIVIIIDELADLMMFAPVEVEDAIARIAQMARATGIHLVIATQRPSVNVITGLIKANIPTRIAFSVSSMVDSRVIIDGPGAEKLLGRGDMLYIPPDQAKPTRIQGAFVDEKTGIKKLVEYLKSKSPHVEYTEEITTQPLPLKKGAGGSSIGANGHDQLFEESIRIICQHDKASASLLQRRLSIGYARAARILDQLEEVGIVGHAEGSKPRDVLVRNADDFLRTMQTQ